MIRNVSVIFALVLVLLSGCSTLKSEKIGDSPAQSQSSTVTQPPSNLNDPGETRQSIRTGNKPVFKTITSADLTILVSDFDNNWSPDQMMQGKLFSQDGCVYVQNMPGEQPAQSLVAFPKGTTLKGQVIVDPEGEEFRLGEEVNGAGGTVDIPVFTGAEPSECKAGSVFYLLNYDFLGRSLYHGLDPVHDED